MEQLPANVDTLLYIAAGLFGVITILGRIVDKLIERVLPAPKNGPGREIVDELRALKSVIRDGSRDQKLMIQHLHEAHERAREVALREDPETGLPRAWCQARSITVEQTKDISNAIERGFERVAAEVKKAG